MKLNIHIMKSRKINDKQTNRIKRAAQIAFVEYELSRCTTIMFVYIDGDPILQKIIFLN